MDWTESLLVFTSSCPMCPVAVVILCLCVCCDQARGVGWSCNMRLCRLLTDLSRCIKSTLSARLITVLFYSLSLNALPIVGLVTCPAESSPSAVLQYWPASCLMALSSISLFLATSCYIKLVLMVVAAVAYNVVCYVTSGHVSYSDNSSTQ